MPKQRLIHLDYFRALAILVIIAGHTYGHWQIDANWEKNLVNLITGGTAFFVFISGFFFQTLFIKNFEYSTFLIKKSKILLIPYLVLSIPFLLLLYWEFGHIPNTYQLPDYLLNDFSLGFMRLITGATFSAFWYIPFIMGIFVLSPLFIAFSKLNPIIMLSLLLILFLGAGFIHRPDNWIIRNADLLQSLIYFSGFYAFGIFYAKYRQAIEENLIRIWPITLIGLISALILAGLFNQVGNLHKYHWLEIRTFDWMVPIKVFSILFIMTVLLKLAKYRIAALEYIALISFGLFFIHGWIQYLLEYSIGILNYFPFNATSFIGFLSYFSLVVILSILFVDLAKRLLKKHSAWFTGY